LLHVKALKVMVVDGRGWRLLVPFWAVSLGIAFKFDSFNAVKTCAREMEDFIQYACLLLKPSIRGDTWDEGSGLGLQDGPAVKNLERPVSLALIHRSN
jgi:hypothetical protein